MPRISTDNYDTVAAWNGSQDLFVVEQPDGTKVATPAMVKQYVLGNSIDDIYSVMGQMGAKNLNSYPYNETSHTDNGIAWTDNGDGTVVANNTATGNSGFVCHSRVLSSVNKLIVPNGTYILSGCPSGGSSTTFNIGATITKNGSAMALGTDNGSGAIITINGDDNYTDKAIVQIICNIKSGVAASNLTFKPMIRLASDTDNTYQPYAKTNKELTEQISAITNLIDVQEVSVAYPASGTAIQKVQAIATAVYSALTIKRPFTIVNIKGDGVYRAEMFISAVTTSFSYSQALFMGYYTDKIYRIEYSNGTVTVKQLAEV